MKKRVIERKLLFVLLFALLAAGCILSVCPLRVLAVETFTLDSGSISAKTINKNGNAGKALRFKGATFTLVMDEDLSLACIMPYNLSAETKLTIMGQHTLTLDSYDYDPELTFAKAPAPLKATDILIDKGTTVNLRSRWYSIYAGNNVWIKGGACINIKKVSNIAIHAGNGLYVTDSRITCPNRGDGMGDAGSACVCNAQTELVIKNSEVTDAYGYSDVLYGRDAVRIEDSRIQAFSRDFCIRSAKDVSIINSRISTLASGDGHNESLSGINAYENLLIKKSEVSSEGNPCGIYGGSKAGTQILIQDSRVNAKGGKNAIASANPIVLSGTNMHVLSPYKGKPGKTNWSSKAPYGILTAALATANNVQIGPVSSTVSGSVTPDKPVHVDQIEKAALSVLAEKDMDGSTYSLLQAKGKPKSKKAVKLTWQKVDGAASYFIYGSKCGKKKLYKKLATVTGTSWTDRKLKKGTYYKYIVMATDGNRTLAVSKTIHVATKGGRYGNNTGVTLKLGSRKVKKITVKAGKTKKVKAVLKQGSLKVKIHRKVKFESSNTDIATVTKKGKIRGISKGTCYVYAYAQNGLSAKVKVTVP